MRGSKRFKVLERRVLHLRAILLPSEYNPTGTYSQAVYDKTTAYRLMSHAEFESYVEDIVKETVDLAVERWNKLGIVSIPVACIVASFETTERINSFPKDPKKPRPPAISTYINKSHVHFKHHIDGNNGIRTQNLLSMLVQVGIEEKDLDATWVGAVDAFGAHRNVVGHNSGVIAYQADPKTAFDATQTICDGLHDVDERLTKLRALIKRRRRM